MLVILIVVYTKGAKKFGEIAIGAIVSLDIFLFRLISCASMNSVRPLAPAVILVIILIYGFILQRHLLELQ